MISMLSTVQFTEGSKASIISSPDLPPMNLNNITSSNLTNTDNTTLNNEAADNEATLNPMIQSIPQ